MKLNDNQKQMLDTMLTEYWYSNVKYNPSDEKDYNQLHDFLNKLMEGKK
jgi:hypothetical protein